MSPRAVTFLRTLAGFAVSVVASLSVAAYRETAGVQGVRALPSPASSLLSRLVASGPGLTVIGLAGFAVGLAPLALMRASLRRPFLNGLGVGLFWLCLAFAGKPYSLGLTAPPGIAIVSVFLAVIVSGAAIGRSVLSGENERPL